MSTRRFTGNGRVRTTSETVSKLDAFLGRLRGAGATPDEVEAFRSIWVDAGEDGGWIVPRAQLVALSDADLRRLIVWHRREYYKHTHDETQEADDVRRARYQSVLDEWNAADHPLRVDEVTEWVGADPVRANVALSFEHLRDEADRRVTLLRFLAPIADPQPMPELDGYTDPLATVAPAAPADETNGISL